MPSYKNPTKKSLPNGHPMSPGSYELHHVVAIQALYNGDASPEQQKTAIRWILDEASRYQEVSFWLDDPTNRFTSFAEGRRFAGKQIMKLVELNLSALAQRMKENARNT